MINGGVDKWGSTRFGKSAYQAGYDKYMLFSIYTANTADSIASKYGMLQKENCTLM